MIADDGDVSGTGEFTRRAADTHPIGAGVDVPAALLTVHATAAMSVKRVEIDWSSPLLGDPERARKLLPDLVQAASNSALDAARAEAARITEAAMAEMQAEMMQSIMSGGGAGGLPGPLGALFGGGANPRK